MRFEPKQGLHVAVGTEKGKVLLYDMRYPVPIYTLNHHYRMPILNVKFFESTQKKCILSCDKKIIKIFH